MWRPLGPAIRMTAPQRLGKVVTPLVLLSTHTARRQRNGVESKVVRQYEMGRGMVSEWHSSEPLEAIPRGQIPLPSTDIWRKIGLSGDAVDLGRVPF